MLNVCRAFQCVHVTDVHNVQSDVRIVVMLQEWYDERLTWVPEEHNGMKEVIIEAERLWRPEFAVING